MSYKYLVALGGCVLGCGTVVPLQHSERAVIGWTDSGFAYCMEPVGIERAPGGLVLASTYGVQQASLAAPKEGAAPADAQAQAQAVAELSLFAREGLYRICEARRNGDLSEEAALRERRELTALLVCLIEAQTGGQQPVTGSRAADCLKAAGTLPQIANTPPAPLGDGRPAASVRGSWR